MAIVVALTQIFTTHLTYAYSPRRESVFGAAPATVAGARLPRLQQASCKSGMAASHACWYAPCSIGGQVTTINEGAFLPTNHLNPPR